MISILISTLNASKVLEGCLESVLGQSDAAFEILVADGGSTDGTTDILTAFNDRIAYWHSRPDKGVYDAWNQLLPHARGEWLMFLGADDRLADLHVLSALDAELAKLERVDPSIGYVYGRVDLVDHGNAIETFGTSDWTDGARRLQDPWPFSHTGLLHRRSLFSRYGEFNAAYRVAGDYEFVTRTLLDGSVHTARVPVRVARMATGGMSTSPASRFRGYREVIRARQSLGLRPSAPPWLLRLFVRSQAIRVLDRVAGKRGLLFAANVYRRILGKPLRGNF